ncbi:DUF4062 domain-containing protein [Methylobacterium sp. A52T]
MRKSDHVLKVMLSSTFSDLTAEREAARDAILGQKMLPLLMEVSPAMPDRGIIENSMEMVEEADIYVVLISHYRYGQVIEDVDLNPQKLSVTELEFRRAEELGLPICVFLQDADVLARPSDVLKEASNQDKLLAFRARARDRKRINCKFGDPKDVKSSLTQCLARLAIVVKDLQLAPPRDAIRHPSTVGLLSPPPMLVARPRYTAGHAFEGRQHEIALLDKWSCGNDPVLVLEAIGGMGKSMLTWHWVNTHVARLNIPWAGRFWYSFYERGADMLEFVVTAVAYMTQRAPGTVRSLTEDEVIEEFLLEVQKKSWLLVLDGLERVLAAYHRADAAQARDEDIEQSLGERRIKPSDCIRPNDDYLLRQLTASGPSRILITSRLMPHALWTGSAPRAGVRHEVLRGLAPGDAAAMMRQAGITGDSKRMQRYLQETVGGHPLVVGFIAGLVRNALWAGMNFDDWMNDPRGGGAINLADPELKQRQNHILKQAFDALDLDARALMARLGMLSGAVGLDVLEALNPKRPDPPEAVSDPRSELGYDYPFLFQSDAGDPKSSRRSAKRKPGTRRAEFRRSYNAACSEFEAYQAKLAAWRQSPAIFIASTWLHATLNDLELRGLVQLDRHNGTVDLHPVVRGYAVDCLGEDARSHAGQRVADYFASKPEPAYTSVTSVSELSNSLQVVQALILANKLDAAWSALSNLEKALRRLERSDLLLALLRPWFPNGWQAPPVTVGERGRIAPTVTHALWEIGRYADAEAQIVFQIEDLRGERLSRNHTTMLHNHSKVLDQLGAVASVQRVLDLSKEIVSVIEDRHQMLHCYLIEVDFMIDRGDISDARMLWEKFSADLKGDYCCEQLDVARMVIEGELLYHEGKLTTAWFEGAFHRARAGRWRSNERYLFLLQGQWFQDQHHDTAAVQSFDRALEMAREVGISDEYSEVMRGLSLLSLGDRASAEDAAASAERNPPRAALATLYLALGQRDMARKHALEGYKKAWADGPPHSRHWALEKCRFVLRSLNEQEPILPLFDHSKIRTLPYEADLRRKLTQYYTRTNM